MSEASGSGDSSSPRSWGAERGRLSLPSTSRNGAVPHDGLPSRPPASGEEEEEPEAAGEEPRQPEDAGDERSRRMIRNQYRELIHSVQRKRGARRPSERPGPPRRGATAPVPRRACGGVCPGAAGGAGAAVPAPGWQPLLPVWGTLKAFVGTPGSLAC